MEVWKPVVGHEGSYEVSDLGRVRSRDRTLMDRDGMTLPADTCDCCSKHSESPSVEAFEITGDIMCADCWDTYCERQWDSQFEGEPPVSLDEQHRAAWAQKQALR